MKRTGANNPKPERLKEGIRAARAKIQNYMHNQRRLAEEAEMRAREIHMGREPTVRSMSQSTDTESSNRMRKRRSSVARDSFDHREDIPVTSQYDGVDAYM